MEECKVTKARRPDETTAPPWCDTHKQRHYSCLVNRLEESDLQYREYREGVAKGTCDCPAHGHVESNKHDACCNYLFVLKQIERHKSNERGAEVCPDCGSPDHGRCQSLNERGAGEILQGEKVQFRNASNTATIATVWIDANDTRHREVHDTHEKTLCAWKPFSVISKQCTFTPGHKGRHSWQ